MPPKFAAKKSSASTSKCRRSARLAYRIKSGKKGQTASSKEEKEREKLPYRKKSVAKRQPASSKEQPSSTKESGKPPYSKKSVTKRQTASSNEGQSTSTVKRRRVMKMDEINERASQMGQQGQEDFTTLIKEILGELSPDLIILEDAIADMNSYLNHVFERVARTSAIFLIGKNEVFMTDKDIETAVLHVVGGELAKYCVAEGRRAVKKLNEEE